MKSLNVLLAAAALVSALTPTTASAQRVLRGSIAHIEPRGDRNGAAATQFGGSNYAEVNQQGRDQTGILRQNGDGNSAFLRQRGANNSGAIVQTGDNNRACLRQFGSGHDATIVQDGGDRANVIQSPNGATRVSDRTITVGRLMFRC